MSCRKIKNNTFQASLMINRTSDNGESPHGWELVAACGVCDLKNNISMSSLDYFPETNVKIRFSSSPALVQIKARRPGPGAKLTLHFGLPLSTH